MSTRAQKLIVLGIIVAASFVLLQPSAMADTRHGRDCATAATVELNTEGHGAFADTADRAVYRIVLERRGLLDVWTDAGNMDLWNVELLDSSCNTITGVGAGDSVVGNGYMPITIPHLNLKPQDSVWTLDAGTYFVRFIPDPVDVFGDPFIFHTSFVPHYGHDFKTAESVAVPASINGFMLYPEDREVFRIQLRHSAAIHAWTTGPGESTPLPAVRLNGPQADNDNDPPSDDYTAQEIRSGVLTPGDYFLVVQPVKPDLLGAFTLHVEIANVQ